MLHAGEHVPHFDVVTLEGTRVAYVTIWQQKHLMLVLLPDEHSSPATVYVSRLAVLISEESLGDVACVFTREAIPGLASPGVLVADRWGEIYLVADGASIDELPPPGDVVDWLRHVRMRCPECEGEAR